MPGLQSLTAPTGLQPAGGLQSITSSTGAMITLPVQVPPNGFPGGKLQFKTPDGRWIQVVIPTGHAPGSVINVQVPAVQSRQAHNFKSLHEAFLHCSGSKGTITDKNQFKEVAQMLTQARGNVEEVWAELDLDHNGCVNWPEFVEWAEAHHVDLEIGESGGDGAMSFPSSWTGPVDDPKWLLLEDVTNSILLNEISTLLALTYKNTWTRDRKATGVDKVPSSYVLVKAQRCENYKDWRRYYLKRHLLASDCSRKSGMMQTEALTSKAAALCRRHGLRTHINEWLLFHGTSHKAAQAIVSGVSDFVMSLAGSATGTLYGKGTYFAESITKADEYSKEDSDGVCCVLLCRILGGHVLYNDEVTPDPNKLQQSCLSGQFHSILGDREKCRNTFKEYIVFDADQVYVEYVIYYKRVYEADG